MFALFSGSVLLLQAQTVVQPPEQARNQLAEQLAARLSSLLPRRTTVSLEWQNQTSLPPAEWLSFRNLLLDELRKAGVETAGTPPETRVRVTLSDSARGLLLVAEVFNGDNRQVAVLPWNLSASAQGQPRIRLTKKVLWTQPEPILDILTLDSDSQLLVLDTGKIASYRLMGDKWMPIASASLVLPRPLPRDPRGRLEATSDGFRAFLPGATCAGAFQPRLKLVCTSGNETWPDVPARWVTDRNVLESDSMKTPFYATANGLFAGTDGHAQDRSGQPIAGAEGWGSDIAGVDDPCADGSAVIASSASGERDEVRVYEIANGQVTPASDGISLAGGVTALWPSESRGQATLVLENPQTGEYEASRLGLACTQ
jgi:hypothetical protein